MPQNGIFPYIFPSIRETRRSAGPSRFGDDQRSSFMPF